MLFKDRKPSRSGARAAEVETKVRRAVGQLRHGMPVTPAAAAGSGALGAGAIGALAIGALAIGSVAVGAFAIGRLSVGSAVSERPTSAGCGSAGSSSARWPVRTIPAEPWSD